jgi:hypothetical protein
MIISPPVVFSMIIPSLIIPVLISVVRIFPSEDL